MNFKIRTYNNISPVGLSRFPPEQYEVSDDEENPDAIILRSQDLHGMEIPPSLRAVGRAGAGTNNIPVDRMGEAGVVVFNTPGANANSVKELVVAGMLLASRHVADAWDYTRHLEGSDEEISRMVEAGKKRFAGQELKDKTIGIIGLGSIGRSVANICVELGLSVVGYDPGLTVEGAWQLSSEVKRARKLSEVFPAADFLTFHVPLVAATRNMINSDTIRLLKHGATLLNFARSGIVDDGVARAALERGDLSAYVTDFPNGTILGVPGVIALPHLGASTREAEENCAVMVVDELRDFLENGNIRNSVNLPEVVMARGTDHRLAVINANVPNMVGQISSALAEAGINIHDMMNQSRGGLAYTVMDTDNPVPPGVLQNIAGIEGVLRAVKI